MKKKVVNRKLDYFKNKSIRIITGNTRYPDISPMADSKVATAILKSVCNDEEIKKIEKDFNKFYKLIYHYCLEQKAKEILTQFKESIKQTYFIHLASLIEFESFPKELGTNNAKKENELLNDDVLRMDRISNAIQKLFFLADLVIASIVGQNNTLKLYLDRSKVMSGKKLTEGKKSILLKIINHRNELKSRGLSSHKYSWKVTINYVYAKLSENEKRSLLGLELKDKNVDTPRSLTMKNLKTISATISYHQERDNLPK